MTWIDSSGYNTIAIDLDESGMTNINSCLNLYIVIYVYYLFTHYDVTVRQVLGYKNECSLTVTMWQLGRC